MKFEKIWLYDNVIIGNNHLAINSGLVEVAFHLKGTYGQLTFFGERRHVETISSMASPQILSVLSIEPLKVIAPKSGIISKIISWVQKLKTDKKELKAFLQKASREKPDIIIFNTLIPSNLPFSFDQIRKYPQLRFLLVLHGEIELLFRQQTDLFSKSKQYSYQAAFKRVPDNLTLVTLNDYSRKQLIHSGWVGEKDVIALPHPLPPVSKGYFNQYVKGTIHLVHFGIGSRRKGSEHLFELANAEECTNHLHFTLLGRLDKELSELQSDKVHVLSKDGKPIPQHIYEREMANADYSLVFLPKHEYRYRVSGSLLDSIVYHKPIIALEHPAVNELFTKGGDLGYICDDLDDMRHLICRLNDKDPELLNRYPFQVENLKRIHQLFSPRYIATLLKEKLHEKYLV